MLQAWAYKTMHNSLQHYSWACSNYSVVVWPTRPQDHNTTVRPVQTIVLQVGLQDHNTPTYNWACPNYSVAGGPTRPQHYNTTVGPVQTIVLQVGLQDHNTTTCTTVGPVQTIGAAGGPTRPQHYIWACPNYSWV